MIEKEKAIYRIREFNRFYLPKLKLLDNHYLGSKYTPTEARVLYEIYANDGCNAAYITKAMNIDKSYLSRIIRGYEKKGYLYRKMSTTDSRTYHLHLTTVGLERTKIFIQMSNQQIESVIQHLHDNDYVKLIEAMNMITLILQKGNE